MIQEYIKGEGFMAKVKEIQVCGGRIFADLSGACLNYVESILQGTDREKMHFTIILDDGSVKTITFRQQDDGIHVFWLVKRW